MGNAGGSENRVQEIKKISIGDYAVSTVYEYSGVGAAIQEQEILAVICILL